MSYIGRQLNVPASTVQLTAEGAITAGKPCIIEVDGDVAQVADAGDAQAVGTPVIFENDSAAYISVAYDANAQKVVIAYRDVGNSNYGTAIVGTISGSSISFGSPTVFESADSMYICAVYDSNAQKVVIAYSDSGNSTYGTAIVGTVSGTSISFGSPTVFESANTYANAMAYDSNAQKVVIAYEDVGAGSHGTSVVGTVSGTSISFGTPVVFASAHSDHVSVTYDANAQKIVIAYRDVANSNYGTAIVGTVSGTSISFGSEVVFESANSTAMSAAYDASAQKIVIVYRDIGNSSYGTAIVGTVSGTSISFGTAVVFVSGASTQMAAIYSPDAQKVAIAYRDGANSNYGTAIAGTVSGTSISFESSIAFESAAITTVESGMAYDSNAQKVVIGYRDEGNSNYGTAVVYTTPYSSINLTSENFIGFAENDCTDNGLATIQLGGAVNDKQTSLTAGQTYFVQTDGTIGTTAASPSVTAGTAVSSTEILVKG
jgi:hypothetical protein